MDRDQADGSAAELDRARRAIARRLLRREQALHLLQEVQRANTHIQKTLFAELEQEKSRADRLLANILPEEVIPRLNAGETTISDAIESATVVFSDFVGFTRISADLSAAELVQTLNRFYSAFDAAARRIGVEKIKTIGDAYMAVSGLHGRTEDHAKLAVGFALEIRDTVAALNAELAQDWQVRVGVHSGSLTAGVIGTHKFAFDVWGDTVNIASRVQGAAAPGTVAVSAATADLLDGAFLLSNGRTVALKGRGDQLIFDVDAG